MNDVTNHVDGRGHRRGIRLRLAGSLASALVVGLALIAAACSRGLPEPGAAHGSAPSPAAEGPSSGAPAPPGVPVAFAGGLRPPGVRHSPKRTPNCPPPAFLAVD